MTDEEKPKKGPNRRRFLQGVATVFGVAGVEPKVVVNALAESAPAVLTPAAQLSGLLKGVMSIKEAAWLDNRSNGSNDYWNKCGSKEECSAGRNRTQLLEDGTGDNYVLALSAKLDHIQTLHAQKSQFCSTLRENPELSKIYQEVIRANTLSDEEFGVFESMLKGRCKDNDEQYNYAEIFWSPSQWLDSLLIPLMKYYNNDPGNEELLRHRKELHNVFNTLLGLSLEQPQQALTNDERKEKKRLIEEAINQRYGDRNNPLGAFLVDLKQYSNQYPDDRFYKRSFFGDQPAAYLASHYYFEQRIKKFKALGVSQADADKLLSLYKTIFGSPCPGYAESRGTRTVSLKKFELAIPTQQQIDKDFEYLLGDYARTVFAQIDMMHSFDNNLSDVELWKKITRKSIEMIRDKLPESLQDMAIKGFESCLNSILQPPRNQPEDSHHKKAREEIEAELNKAMGLHGLVSSQDIVQGIDGKAERLENVEYSIPIKNEPKNTNTDTWISIEDLERDITFQAALAANREAEDQRRERETSKDTQEMIQ